MARGAGLTQHSQCSHLPPMMSTHHPAAAADAAADPCITHIDIPTAVQRKTELYVELAGDTKTIECVMQIARAGKAKGAWRCRCGWGSGAGWLWGLEGRGLSWAGGQGRVLARQRLGTGAAHAVPDPALPPPQACRWPLPRAAAGRRWRSRCERWGCGRGSLTPW